MQLSSFFNVINSGAIIDRKNAHKHTKSTVLHTQRLDQDVRLITSMINLTPTKGVGISFICVAPCDTSAKNQIPLNDFKY